ncbi:PTS glucose transporter subunit IIA [Actinotalea ferrariae]|uniref:PTS sugar transporter subunit IIA n=1 Tax=Actinotalea ferrariae TaxID=1386098 RepID=UPI001C8C8915|nr:PTS glucose transporter subunit IIA [Actinotalea ferrariae]MBX9245920.1 PTS glucose transporter subunit IIA [Actinotalea ferrariae]
MALTLVAPVAGTVLAMADVPDPVFAGAIVGPGLAVDPDRDGGGEGTVSHAVAPVDGTVVKLHPHAFVVQVDEHRAVLVHLGLDTVQLAGEGFTLHVGEGATVSTGDRVVSWDPAAVAAGGRSPVVPVVAVQGEPGAVRGLVEPGERVTVGTPFLEWD